MQLVRDISQVVFDGVLAYHQSLRQLAIRSNALHKEVQHLAFAIRQLRRPIGGRWRCRRGTRELAQELSGETRRESRFAAGDTLEQTEKLVGVEVLEQIALR